MLVHEDANLEDGLLQQHPRRGLVVACAGAAGSFFRYAKLMFLAGKKP